MAKLTNEQAEKIRRLYSVGESTQVHLARTFGVSVQTIRKILSGESYRQDFCETHDMIASV